MSFSYPSILTPSPPAHARRHFLRGEFDPLTFSLRFALGAEQKRRAHHIPVFSRDAQSREWSLRAGHYISFYHRARRWPALLDLLRRNGLP